MKPYAWAILVIAGVFETGFSVGLKYWKDLLGCGRR